MTDNQSTHKELARRVRETSFRDEGAPTIKLASGRMSQYYVDCKMALSHPDIRNMIGELMTAKLGDRIERADAIGGMELGAYPVGMALSDYLYRERGINLPVFIVRKQPKGHGMKKTIEGDVADGASVIVVEDVITTGGSTKVAIQRCIEERQMKIVAAIAVVDRMEGRDGPVYEGDTPLESILTLDDLVKAV